MTTTTKTRATIVLKQRLANLKDELERYGWRPDQTARYMRDALRAMAPEDVVALFAEMAGEERRYYEQHAPLADDQLDHTLVAA